MTRSFTLTATLLSILLLPSRPALAQEAALFTRNELSRFICSAMTGGDVRRAISNLSPSLGDVQAKRSTQSTYFIEEVSRGDRLNSVKFRRQGRLSTGIGYSHELRITQDDSVVWFEDLEEARTWLQAAGLLTKTDPELGVWGYAAEAESTFSRVERSAEPRFDFRVLVDPSNSISIKWRTPEQAQLASGFCSLRSR